MSHYDESYFNWQKQMGEIGGHINKFLFREEIQDADVLMDFGCGGGYLLAQFPNTHKIGFEINKSAWSECVRNNVRVTDTYDDIEDDSVDTILSCHALEHVPSPFETLRQLYKKLKRGGKFILIVPCEQPSENSFYYSPNDINQHLYTWCPMTLGNLVTLSGFRVLSSLPIQHQWCPDYKERYREPDFHTRCIEYAKKNKNIQIKVIAKKE